MNILATVAKVTDPKTGREFGFVWDKSYTIVNVSLPWNQYFEGEAYLLKYHCENNGLVYEERDFEVSI